MIFATFFGEPDEDNPLKDMKINLSSGGAKRLGLLGLSGSLRFYGHYMRHAHALCGIFFFRHARVVNPDNNTPSSP